MRRFIFTYSISSTFFQRDLHCKGVLHCTFDWGDFVLFSWWFYFLSEGVGGSSLYFWLRWFHVIFLVMGVLHFPDFFPPLFPCIRWDWAFPDFFPSLFPCRWGSLRSVFFRHCSLHWVRYFSHHCSSACYFIECVIFPVIVPCRRKRESCFRQRCLLMMILFCWIGEESHECLF